MIERGAVHWTDLGSPSGSKPAKRRPVLVIQSDGLNNSRLRTAVVVTITSNTEAAARPGNVFLPAGSAGLGKDSVVNVSAVSTVDKADLDPPVGHLPAHLFHKVEDGLRLVLGL